MKITVIGNGYVGLVTAAVFADLGNDVWCVGRTKEKIEKLKKGMIPFFEPGLEEVVRKNATAQRLRFTLSYEETISGSDIIFICVGTPSLQSGEADLSQVYASAETIGKNLGKGQKVIVVKSTVPVGTTKRVAEIIKKVKPKGADFEVAFVPEFLREGTALADTLQPDRIVIGTDSLSAQKILMELHKPINGHFVLTNIPSAEMIKYASNSLLATKISFANAIAFLCEEVGADVLQVLDGVGLDKRLGRSFLNPGVGYGGSCFPKDVKALNAMFKKAQIKVNLFAEVEEINRQAAENFVNKVIKLLDPVKGKTVAVLGLAFKPNTDDMREAPSIKVIKALQSKGVKIRAFDPVAISKAQEILKNVVYCKNPEETVKGADALLIMTEWNEFKQLDLVKIKKLMNQPIIVDGRNIYDPEKIIKLGFIYKGVGR